MPKAPEPSSTCQKTTKSLPRISPKSYCYNAVPNRFLAHFSTSRTNGPRLLSRAKAGNTLGSRRKIAHNGSHGETRGVSDGGGITTLGAFRTFTNIPGPGIRKVYFAAFGSWPGVLPKNAESLRDSDAHDARRCSEGVAAPLGCVIFFRFCRNYGFHTLRSRLSVCARGVVSLPSACFACC